ncbi:hypothetical protein HanIR_Chr03g0138341 [Helianthus annuus]|nr:hypothetical protein HanIR_Chr03g0138341 [Helianthus annuus]
MTTSVSSPLTHQQWVIEPRKRYISNNIKMLHMAFSNLCNILYNQTLSNIFH